MLFALLWNWLAQGNDAINDGFTDVRFVGAMSAAGRSLPLACPSVRPDNYPCGMNRSTTVALPSAPADVWGLQATSPRG